MFIRKSKITSLIKKERQKERKICEKGSAQELEKLKKEIEKKHSKAITKLEQNHKDIIYQKNMEIKKLGKEIDKNYSAYQEIRKREKFLDNLTHDVEGEVERMVIKVQESLQPFYRTRAKVETIRRKSNRKNEKVENILKAVK